VHALPAVEAQPVHATKMDLASGAAVRVTSVAGVVFGTGAVQPAVEPVVQEIPGPVTVPTPEPLVFTVSGHVFGWNVTVTSRAV
jgi:hypothetical protein